MLEAGGLVEEATGNLPGNKGVGMEEVADDNKRPQVKIACCNFAKVAKRIVCKITFDLSQ